MALRGQTAPFGPYGGLLLSFWRRERTEETPERLEALGAGSGAADVEYEQFVKAKEIQRAMFQAGRDGRWLWAPAGVSLGV